MFDPTISLGNVLATLAAVFSALGVGWKVSMMIKKIQWQNRLMWKWYCKEHGIQNGDDGENNR
jgi:hypothetical protein